MIPLIYFLYLGILFLIVETFFYYGIAGSIGISLGLFYLLQSYAVFEFSIYVWAIICLVLAFAIYGLYKKFLFPQVLRYFSAEQESYIIVMQEETPFICLDGKYKEVFSQDALGNGDVVTILSPGNETIEVSKLIKN